MTRSERLESYRKQVEANGQITAWHRGVAEPTTTPDSMRATQSCNRPSTGETRSQRIGKSAR